MIKLSLEEQETIILWDRKYPEANVYTFDPPLKRKLATMAKAYPEQIRLEKADNGSVEYTLPKNLVSIRSPRQGRKLSEEEKKDLAERLAKGRSDKK